MRRLGYPVSRHLWRQCGNRSDRNLGKLKIKTNMLNFIRIQQAFYSTGGGRTISTGLQNSIDTFLKEKSNIASNRLVKIRNPAHKNYKQAIPARYLENSRSELYQQFPFSNEISKTTFFKYSNINGEYKNPHKLVFLINSSNSFYNFIFTG